MEGLKSPRFPPSGRSWRGNPKGLVQLHGFSTWDCSLCFPVTGKKQGWVGSWDICLGFRAWQTHTNPEMWEFQRAGTAFAQGIVSRTIQGHLLREVGMARRGFLLGIRISGIPDRHSSRCEGWEINSRTSSWHCLSKNPKPTNSTKTSP